MKFTFVVLKKIIKKYYIPDDVTFCYDCAEDEFLSRIYYDKTENCLYFVGYLGCDFYDSLSDLVLVWRF